MARTAVVPEAAPVGALSALLRRSSRRSTMTALDPLLPFKIGSMNGREGRGSRLQLKASVAPVCRRSRYARWGIVTGTWLRPNEKSKDSLLFRPQLPPANSETLRL